MASTQTAIRKLYKEACGSDFSVDIKETALEVIRSAGKCNKLVEHDDSFWVFCKTKNDEGIVFIRMIIAVREENKKVHNVSKITTFIKDLEEVLIYTDKCETCRSDGFIYLDSLKRINT